ncbi:metallophosphoesterase family protein [Umezawaea tangerina]|uniref:DNA repair exonuclease SbcCD nuclease subunit n=1 Tax=Umezawaea tangerina TaxID=84725 RepID=A0A2T0SC86_9PSEU|nr:metallophosphoesterase [Umezawaea tangerina]PRY31022.1 DNA repair exonuclease SbcCD nuclease subunit [Umezawaea tangerina]
MRVLHFADLHLDTPFHGVGPRHARARRAALRTTLLRIVALAREQRVDALLCGGDLYEHDRFSPDTAAFLRDAFEEAAVPVHLAPGHHDRYGPRSPYHQVAWSGNVHVFAEDRLVAETLADGVTLWGAAHRGTTDGDGFLEDFAVDRAGVHLALFHGSELTGLAVQEGGRMPHAAFTARQVEQAGLHHAFLGHFHAPRDAERHTYPGNPDPLTFGEQGRRGAVLHTVHDDGRVDRVRHDVATSRVHDVAVELAGAARTDQVREQVAAAVAGLEGVVRVTLGGAVGPEADLRPDDLARCAPHLEALVVRVGTVRPTTDFAALAEEPTVRGRFVRDVRADEDLDDDTRRRVLVTGLRAFDGRTADLAVL